MCLKALRDLLHIGLDTSHTWIVPPSLEIPATMMTLGTAIRAKRRSHPVPISVLPGNTHAAIEKGTSDEKDSHTARRRNAGVDCCEGLSRLQRSLRAASHDTQFAKRETTN